jgi:hypothetical protein
MMAEYLQRDLPRLSRRRSFPRFMLGIAMFGAVLWALSDKSS